MNEKREKVCPSCGAVIEGEFCTECGEIIEDEAQAVTLSGEEIAAISYAWAHLHMELLRITPKPNLRNSASLRAARAAMNAYTKTLGMLVDRLEKGARQ